MNPRQGMLSRQRQAPSLADLALFAEASVALTLASLAIRTCPFRWIVRSAGLGGKRAGAADPQPIRVAIERASRRLPWRTVCFQEGLAAQWMLRRRGAPAVLHYGIRSDAERLSAHVWISLNGELVIGEEDGTPHAEVGRFPSL
jgi:hypothetical protein